MHIANIRQWQWMLLALALGAGIGAVRQWMLADLEGHFGQPINTQAHFEAALTHLVAGRPCFDDAHVYSAWVPDRNGATKRANVVAGDYFNGQYEQSEGKLKATWRPAFFIADIPYQPKSNLDELGRPDLSARFRAIPNPTVIDFLDVLAQSKGIHYTRARLMDLGIAGWTACSFVGVGVIWPIVINLIVFGTLRRPQEPKGIDLSKVKATATAPKPPVEVDAAVLAELDASLEPDPAATPAEVVPAAAPVPIQPLSGSAFEPVAVACQREQTEFAAKHEDYYPTAKRPGPTHSS